MWWQSSWLCGWCLQGKIMLDHPRMWTRMVPKKLPFIFMIDYFIVVSVKDSFFIFSSVSYESSLFTSKIYTLDGISSHLIYPNAASSRGRHELPWTQGCGAAAAAQRTWSWTSSDPALCRNGSTFGPSEWWNTPPHAMETHIYWCLPKPCNSAKIIITFCLRDL